MRQKWIYGATFPVYGSKNSRVETRAIQETDCTWTAQVVQTVNGETVKSTLFGGFDTLFQALRTANEIALALADEQESAWGNAASHSPDQPYYTGQPRERIYQ